MAPPQIVKALKGAVQNVAKSVAKKVSKTANNDVAPVMDRRFNLIMWIMSLWMMLTWFNPLIVDQVATTVWHERSGVFVNMRSVKKFLNTTDSAFVCSCAIAVIMLTLSVIVTGMYIYSAVKYGKLKTMKKASITTRPWFRCVWLFFFTIFMLIVSIASILDMVCIDSENIRHDAMTLKHLNNKANDIKEFREFSTHALSMAMGETVTYEKYGSMPGAGVLMGKGILARSADGSGLLHFDETTLRGYFSASKLYLGGVMVAVKGNFDSLLAGGLYTFTFQNGNLHLSPVNGPSTYELHPSASEMQQMAFLKISPQEITLSSVVGYILAKKEIPSPTTAQYLKLAGNPNLLAAVAAARLFCAQNSVALYGVYAGAANEFDMDAIINSAHRCTNATMYSTTVFLISFIFGIIAKIAVILYKKVYLEYRRKKAGGHKYESLKAQSDDYDEWDDEDEYGSENGEDDNDDWKAVAPLSNASAI